MTILDYRDSLRTDDRDSLKEIRSRRRFEAERKALWQGRSPGGDGRLVPHGQTARPESERHLCRPEKTTVERRGSEFQCHSRGGKDGLQDRLRLRRLRRVTHGLAAPLSCHARALRRADYNALRPPRRGRRYKPRLWRGRSGCTPGAERFRLTPGMDCGRCAVYGLVFAGLPARAAPGFRGKPPYGGAFRAAALQTAAHHVLIHKHM